MSGCRKSQTRLYRSTGLGKHGKGTDAVKSEFSSGMTGQETRNKLTDYWKNHDIKKGREFAILTNIIHQEWSGLGVKEHKKLREQGQVCC